MKIHTKLHAAKLDGRSLDTKGLRKPGLSETLAVFPALLLAILSAPLTLIGSGLMIFFGKVLGDRTDEGLDARTTYHLLASMLGLHFGCDTHISQIVLKWWKFQKCCQWKFLES